MNRNDRYDSLRICIGENGCRRLSLVKLFMVSIKFEFKCTVFNDQLYLTVSVLFIETDIHVHVTNSLTTLLPIGNF